MSIDQSAAAVRVTAGVDWAKDDHVACVAGDQGCTRTLSLNEQASDSVIRMVHQ